MDLTGPTPDQTRRLITLNRALMTQHLLRGIAHDLRNNLQVVALGASLGDDAGGISVSVRVDRALDEMTAALDLLSRLGRTAANEPAETDVGEALSEAVHLAALQRNLPTLGLTIEPPPAPAAVRMPRSELVQVVLNLVANAKDSGPLATDPVTVGVSAPMDGEVALTVVDRGSGIPPSAGAPFASTKDPANHAGLGLFVVRALVEGRGGRLVCDRLPEGGTRIRVVLPAAGCPA
ncbi:MAG: sensor histidine kinase [Gemmatimonadales bacterium]